MHMIQYVMHGTISPKRTAMSWNRVAIGCFWAAFLVTFVMATLPHPPTIVDTGDKVKHMLAFATLSLLGLTAWPGRFGSIAIGLLFYGAMIEWVQAIPVLCRDSDIHDWYADALAIGVTITTIAIIQRIWARWSRKNAPAFPGKPRRL